MQVGQLGLFLYDLKEVKQEATELVYELLLLNPVSRSPTAQWLERSQSPASPGGGRKVSLKSGLSVLLARGQHSSLLVRTLGPRCGNTNINSIILLLSAKSRTVRIGWPRTPPIRRWLLQYMTSPKTTPQKGCATLTVKWNVMPSLAQRWEHNTHYGRDGSIFICSMYSIPKQLSLIKRT